MKAGTSFGICRLCGECTPKAARLDTSARAARSTILGVASPANSSIYLRAEATGAPIFWIDLEIKADSPLRRLDDLLRRVWLECCGHMSTFEIDGLRYSAVVDHEYGVDRNHEK